MRTRETKRRLDAIEDPKERLKEAVRLSIHHCYSRELGRGEGKEFPLCVERDDLIMGRLDCTPRYGEADDTGCPVYMVTGYSNCMGTGRVSAERLPGCDVLQLTQAQRRHFRREHWRLMRWLLMNIRDWGVGL